MKPRLLLACPLGQPDDPRIWSGTPARLLQALRADGRLELVPHDSRLSARQGRWMQRADGALGLEHSFVPGPAQRWLAGRSVCEAAAQRCEAVLHLSTYDMALPGGPPAFLYADSSYDFWERHARLAARLSPWQRRAFRWLESRAVSRARKIFTVGEHIADNLVAHMGVAAENVLAVGTGLGDIRPWRGPKNYSEARLLIVAKARPREKGLPLLLEAVQLARRQMPALSLTVIGGAKLPELKGIEGVTGTGWLSAGELQSLFDRASLYVMPATYEPWGISYLEALACRAPVVGLNRGALPEITQQGRFGFLLDEATPQALADLLLRALADPLRLARMGEEGQRHCLERYRWDRIAATLADRICAALSKP